MGHWVTGVAVVSARAPDGRPCGLTASAVASLSLDPPLVLVCVERSSDTHGCIRAAGAFALNVLRADQEDIARRFAAADRADKYAGIAWRAERTGAPVLAAALAWLDCRLEATHEGGDHTIFIGEVLAGAGGEGMPLAHFRSSFARVAP